MSNIFEEMLDDILDVGVLPSREREALDHAMHILNMHWPPKPGEKAQ